MTINLLNEIQDIRLTLCKNIVVLKSRLVNSMGSTLFRF